MVVPAAEPPPPAQAVDTWDEGPSLYVPRVSTIGWNKVRAQLRAFSLRLHSRCGPRGPGRCVPRASTAGSFLTSIHSAGRSLLLMYGPKKL